ncbi:MAG: hypothetical protein H7338_12210 [Candidatus Sericytochromatia bacterium]|nr:hypothetical protein [Candidatus Sericytochromatia bacterium]
MSVNFNSSFTPDINTGRAAAPAAAAGAAAAAKTATTVGAAAAKPLDTISFSAASMQAAFSVETPKKTETASADEVIATVSNKFDPKEVFTNMAAKLVSDFRTAPVIV